MAKEIPMKVEFSVADKLVIADPSAERWMAQQTELLRLRRGRGLVYWIRRW